MLFFLAGNTGAQSRLPQFRDHPATERFTGRNAPLILTRRDVMFRTRLRWVARERPNFAGRYILTGWGCGTGCVMGAIIDARTGRVYWFDFTVCCWNGDMDENFQPVEFRLNSKLIIFSGARNERDGDVGTHYYKFENNRFVHIRSIIRE